MERAETRCRCEPPSRFHRRPGRSREPMGAQPDTSTSAPEVRYGVRQILAPVFVPRLLVTYLGLKAHAAPEVWTSLHPALALAKSLERHDALLPILWGLATNVLNQGRVAESLPWAQEMLDVAEATGDADLLIVGHA